MAVLHTLVRLQETSLTVRCRLCDRKPVCDSASIATMGSSEIVRKKFIVILMCVCVDDDDDDDDDFVARRNVMEFD